MPAHWTKTFCTPSKTFSLKISSAAYCSSSFGAESPPGRCCCGPQPRASHTIFFSQATSVDLAVRGTLALRHSRCTPPQAVSRRERYVRQVLEIPIAADHVVGESAELVQCRLPTRKWHLPEGLVRVWQGLQPLAERCHQRFEPCEIVVELHRERLRTAICLFWVRLHKVCRDGIRSESGRHS